MHPGRFLAVGRRADPPHLGAHPVEGAAGARRDPARLAHLRVHRLHQCVRLGRAFGGGFDVPGWLNRLVDKEAVPDCLAAEAAVPDGAVPDGAVPDGAVPDGAGRVRSAP
ncbi:hypothetical protein [Streptomyces violaceoruber]|uniref:Uncharacterized protein n=1 Tax=Streptomyces violaceoruber TaxID=1935 RepID=A0ACD4WK28_STRVN|nr:hypothetical protein R2E43_01860 [Streptomyces violaceoruber]BDD76839.1 hypothetical protein JCM4020_74590 [Streptomyces coelicolor]